MRNADLGGRDGIARVLRLRNAPVDDLAFVGQVEKDEGGVGGAVVGVDGGEGTAKLRVGHAQGFFEDLLGGEVGHLAGSPHRLRAGDEFSPVLVAADVLEEAVVDGHARLGRGSAQAHAGLAGRTPGLAVIARLAGAHEVVPAVGAAAVARYDMVEGEVLSGATAVGAGPAVAGEHLSAGRDAASVADGGRSRPYG